MQRDTTFRLRNRYLSKAVPAYSISFFPNPMQFLSFRNSI